MAGARGIFEKRASWIRLVMQRALKSKCALQQARMQRAVDTTMIADRRFPPVSTSLETLLWPNRVSESCHDNGPIFSIVPPCFGRIGMKCEYNVPERKSRPLFPADIGLGTER
jgi:hypothetical protein